MAERGSWAVQQVSGVGVQTVEDARHSMGALWTPAGAVTSRSGMVPTGAAAVPGSVLATTPTANGFVHVQPFRYVRQSSRGGGTYTMVLDSIKDIDILGAGGQSADPSNSRIDLIIAQQSDTYFGDANSNMVVKRVGGTASGSPVDPTVTGSQDYVLLARVTVPPTVTTIQTANIANVALPSVVAVGGILPVADATARAAITTPYDGMAIYRRDLDWIETYDGTTWRAPARGVIARGFVTTASAAGNPTPAMRLDNIPMLAGHMYHVFTSNVNLFGTANETVSMNLRYSTSGAATTGSAELPGARSEVKLVNGGGAAAQAHCDTVYVPASDQTVSIIVTGERNTGSNNVTVFADATSILALTVKDIGVAPANTAVDL